MEYTDNHKALLEVARAYYRKGADIQYNQLSLDRVVRVTPRRARGMSPESATEENIQFLDCSTYTWTVYYEAFGLELPADLTWEMTDLIEPKVYFHKFAHPESDTDKVKIEKEIRDILEPGDIMVYAKPTGSGHAMLYIGGDEYLNCSMLLRRGDYDYENKCNRFRPEGGILLENIERLFNLTGDEVADRNNLFRDDIDRFSILRPMAAPLEMTTNTKARMAGCVGLDMGLLCGVPKGVNVGLGDIIEYKLVVKNTGSSKKDIRVGFKVPRGDVLDITGAQRVNLEDEIGAGDTKDYVFKVKIEKDPGAYVDEPVVTVNDFVVKTRPVLFGKRPTTEMTDSLLTYIKGNLDSKDNMYALLVEAYEKIGLKLPETTQRMMTDLFVRFDALSGDVIYRRAQNPSADMAVYGHFGGVGVITPEISGDKNIRTTYISKKDLMPGDIILASDRASHVGAYSSVYDGNVLIGNFDETGDIRTLDEKETDRFIDSLFGRFSFVVIRPFLALA